MPQILENGCGWLGEDGYLLCKNEELSSNSQHWCQKMVKAIHISCRDRDRRNTGAVSLALDLARDLV